MVCRSLCPLFVLVPVLAVAAHYYYLAINEAPPSDHGTGSMFDLIAGRYDAINRVLAVGMDVSWRQRMVEIIHESVADVPNPRLLDLATGTADVALLLSKEMPEATVIGVDPSANMLAVGRDKVQRAGFEDKINLQLADSRQLDEVFAEPFSFDAATMAFGIRNVQPGQSQALCQIHRVLKPNARFCILEFSEPSDSFGIMGRAARLFIRHVVPFVGGILSGKPREYWHLQNSIQDFPTPTEFVEVLETLECPTSSETSSSIRAFDVQELIQLNFGSVQIYVMTARGDDAQAEEQ